MGSELGGEVLLERVFPESSVQSPALGLTELVELFAVLVTGTEFENALTLVGGLEVGDETFVIDNFNG